MVKTSVTWHICCWFYLLCTVCGCPSWDQMCICTVVMSPSCLMRRSCQEVLWEGQSTEQIIDQTTTLICPNWSLPKSEKLPGKIMSGSSSKAWWIVWQAMSSLHDLELLIGKVCYKGVHELGPVLSLETCQVSDPIINRCFWMKVKKAALISAELNSFVIF